MYNSKEDIDAKINNERLKNKNKKNLRKKVNTNILIFKNHITKLRRLFKNCSQLYSINFINLDTSNVTDMSWMFNRSNKLKEIKGLNKCNTNKVTKMNSMFQQCNELISLDLSNFNTSNVTDIEGMFHNCNIFKEIKGINNFNTNKVIKMNSKFQKCKEFPKFALKFLL